ncbi:MAG: hypothetical protein KJO39_06615 [Bacteroidia bacterium]|nr:hypothetical protein [Bacteroidia bacterium]NNF31108.1 hypothetical protein [Flavobacteriaceae bacterium]NNJ81311.1 hypothetical protein [Flavobacteriaceae bacterium]NNK55570.1 hypothetical protein [Flavobacteriaceae bacterium]NNM08860.1 hypothetical protein [Flavobacteriaceae bacterium]
MKSIIFLLLSLLIIACNSGMESDIKKNVEAGDIEETDAAAEKELSETLPITSSTNLNYSEIVAQKLQEYADLQSLIQKHPEFKTDLELQLATLSSDSILLQVPSDSISITDISQIRPAEIISDTVEHIPFSFIISSPTVTRKDSLIAVFTTQEVEIDGQIYVSNKVTFKSLSE